MHAEHPDEIAEVELAGQRLRQRGRTGGIVRGVDEHRGRAAHPLQPAGAGDGGESGADSLDVELTLRAGAEEGLDRRQRQRGVVRLVFAVQRQVDIGIHAAESLQRQHLSADSDLAAQDGELRVLAGHRGIGLHGLGQQHFHHFGRLARDDRDGVRCALRRPGDDAGLLPGDAGEIVAQVFDVVDGDRGDDRDRRVDHVGGIPPSTHPHLDHGDVDGGVGERGERHRGQHLELAQSRSSLSENTGLRLRVDHLYERLDLAVGRHVVRRADRRGIDRDAFDRRLQVGAGGAPGATL